MICNISCLHQKYIIYFYSIDANLILLSSLYLVRILITPKKPIKFMYVNGRFINATRKKALKLIRYVTVTNTKKQSWNLKYKLYNINILVIYRTIHITNADKKVFRTSTFLMHSVSSNDTADKSGISIIHFSSMLY